MSTQPGRLPQHKVLLQGKARSCAKEVGVEPHEVEAVLGNAPPSTRLSDGQLEAAQWFHKRWLGAQLQGRPLSLASVTHYDRGLDIDFQFYQHKLHSLASTTNR